MLRNIVVGVLLLVGITASLAFRPENPAASQLNGLWACSFHGLYQSGGDFPDSYHPFLMRITGNTAVIFRDNWRGAGRGTVELNGDTVSIAIRFNSGGTETFTGRLYRAGDWIQGPVEGQNYPARWRGEQKMGKVLEVP